MPGEVSAILDEVDVVPVRSPVRPSRMAWSQREQVRGTDAQPGERRPARVVAAVSSSGRRIRESGRRPPSPGAAREARPHRRDRASVIGAALERGAGP
jgi:hypothetical protein